MKAASVFVFPHAVYLLLYLDSILCCSPVLKFWHNKFNRTFLINNISSIRPFASLDKPNNTNNDNNKNKEKLEKLKKVTLLSDGNKVEVSSLQDAQKIAVRRNLKLVKLVDVDNKTQRPVYKLMSAAEFFELESKQRNLPKGAKASKGEKLLSVSGRIESNDLSAKVKLLEKWMSKGYEIRVLINKDNCDITKIEGIVDTIGKSIRDNAKIVQKRWGGSDVRFSIVPVISSQPEKYL